MITPVSNRQFFEESVPMTERELIFKLRSGSGDAFNTLYKMYSTALMGVLMQVVKQQETAEDLLQDCFIKINRNFDSYQEGKSRLFTWMLNITRHTAIDHLRRRSSQNQKKTLGLDSVANDIENRFTHNFNTDTIGMKKIIAALEPKHKLMIDMIYFQGFTHAEVSEALNMPIGSVKTSLRYAVLCLRKIFFTEQRTVA